MTISSDLFPLHSRNAIRNCNHPQPL